MRIQRLLNWRVICKQKKRRCDSPVRKLVCPYCTIPYYTSSYHTILVWAKENTEQDPQRILHPWTLQSPGTCCMPTCCKHVACLLVAGMLYTHLLQASGMPSCCRQVACCNMPSCCRHAACPVVAEVLCAQLLQTCSKPS